MAGRLVACSSCAVHVRECETRCPFCGLRGPQNASGVTHVAGAALLGLALASCQIEPEYGVPYTETETETETESTTETDATTTTGTTESTETTTSTTSESADGSAEDLPCEMLDPDACAARSDCIVSDVHVFRLDEDGVCELIAQAPECLESTTVTDGCAGWCGSAPAPWYEERADSGTAIADVDVCGEAIADWSECHITDEGIVPEVCACACER